MSIFEHIAKATKWECLNSGKNAVRAIAPFSFAIDGQYISFYVAQRNDNKFFITDAGNTAMLLSSHGIEITLKKIQGVINRSDISTVSISPSGEIVGECDAEDLGFFLWDAALLAYRISIEAQAWRPKLDQIRFTQLTKEIITTKVGNTRIITKANTKGISGHVIEFPFAVRSVSNDFFTLLSQSPPTHWDILLGP